MPCSALDSAENRGTNVIEDFTPEQLKGLVALTPEPDIVTWPSFGSVAARRVGGFERDGVCRALCVWEWVAWLYRAPGDDRWPIVWGYWVDGINHTSEGTTVRVLATLQRNPQEQERLQEVWRERQRRS